VRSHTARIIKGGPMVTTSARVLPLYCLPSFSISSSGMETNPFCPKLPSLLV
jgi:hypothetical protein